MLGKTIKKYLDQNGIKYSYISDKSGIPMNILSPMLNERREIKATAYTGIMVDGLPEFLKMGTYLVDEPVAPDISINLTAYDNMIWLDKEASRC